MKKSWAYKWAAYLEAPGRKQYTNHLVKAGATANNKTSPACCLGHLERLAGTKFDQYGYADNGETREKSYLTQKTRGLVEMQSTGGQLPVDVSFGGTVWGSLSALNDAGMSLKQIAKLIRKFYKEL